MVVFLVDKDDQYVLNHCTKFLARDSMEPRHDFGQYAADDPRAGICEAWRFPIVDSHYDSVSVESSYEYNDVTFVHDARGEGVRSVAVVGTFGDLYAPTPLREVTFLGESTGLRTATVRIRKGQVHSYLFLVDGRREL